MKKNLLSAALTAAVLALASAAPAQASVFNFNFDASPDGTVTGPFVGTGTFSFTGTATAGTFSLSSLSGYAFDFTVNGNHFTAANLATSVSNILVSITSSGQDLLAHFGGAGGGPFGGSMDFVNGGANLSFQPAFGPLYFSGSSFGTYEGVLSTAPSAVPEPLSASLVGLGLAGIVAVRRRRS